MLICPSMTSHEKFMEMVCGHSHDWLWLWSWKFVTSCSCSHEIWGQITEPNWTFKHYNYFTKESNLGIKAFQQDLFRNSSGFMEQKHGENKWSMVWLGLVTNGDFKLKGVSCKENIQNSWFTAIQTEVCVGMLKRVSVLQTETEVKLKNQARKQTSLKGQARYQTH